MPASRQHAPPEGATHPTVPEVSLAERARTLIHIGRVGTLSTHSLKQPGFPFGSVMPYVADSCGRPIFFISSMAMHTHNARQDPRASLLVMEAGSHDPLGAARITLLGEVRPVAEAEVAPARELYLKVHENARYWAEFSDFAFYRLEPVDVYFVGGFGVMGWIAAEAYAGSQPDPLAETAQEILRHMNQDHPRALLRLACTAGEIGVASAVMTAVDRLGFQLRLGNGARVYSIRIAFPREVRNSAEVRAVLVEMCRAPVAG
jgi:putative heme iron utilization protein